MVTAVIIALVVLVSAVLYWVSQRKPVLPAIEDDEPALKPVDRTAATLKEPVPAVKPARVEATPPAPAAEKRPAPPPRPSSGQHKLDLPKPPASQPQVASQAPVSQKEMASLRKGLGSARKGFIGRLSDLLSGKKEIDESILGELEEVLLSSDVGPETTRVLVDRLKARLERNELGNVEAVWKALRAEATQILSLPGGALKLGQKPTVVLLVGVNGAGKTTTIGKLATHFSGSGKKVLLAAGDTFRAAAVAQLEVWGKRVGADVVKGKEGADPGAVAFEATTKAKAEGADLLLVDTAGRLQNKTPLMDEIRKVRKTIDKADPGAPHETFLVLDATTGQNALSQAKLFKEALDLTGIVLTKLDGTAKGGIVLGIADQLKVPVRYIGLGERAEDLREFHAESFVEALFANPTAEV